MAKSKTLTKQQVEYARSRMTSIVKNVLFELRESFKIHAYFDHMGYCESFPEPTSNYFSDERVFAEIQSGAAKFVDSNRGFCKSNITWPGQQEELKQIHCEQLAAAEKYNQIVKRINQVQQQALDDLIFGPNGLDLLLDFETKIQSIIK